MAPPPTTSQVSRTVRVSKINGGRYSQKRIYLRLQKMKDMYSADLRAVIDRLTVKCSQPVEADKLEKLRRYKTKLERMINYFHVPKDSIPLGLPEYKVDAIERQIVYILNAFMLANPAMQQQGHQ